MRFSNILAILTALYIGTLMIPQELFAQVILNNNQLSYNKLNQSGDQYIADDWMPCLYPGSRQMLSGMEVKNTERQGKASLQNNEITSYQPFINNANLNHSNVVPSHSDNEDAAKNTTSFYLINPAVDIPIVAVGTVWSVYALSKIYNKTPPTASDVQGLNKNDIPFFDRWAIYPYDKNLDKISYYPFYASIPLPFLFFLSNEQTSKDFFKLSFLYWETLSIMGLLGTSSTYFIDRYRPYTYTDQTPMDVRTNKVARNSFFSGHIEMIAAPTFLIAKVYSDYYPESNMKWAYYGFAITITTVTSYMRLKSGEHFPSDIVLGAVVGALAGILVPEYHKNHNSDLSILPYSNEMAKGIAF